MPKFSDIPVKSWDEFLKVGRRFASGWVFRGQPSDWPLTTTLERACKIAGVSLKFAPGIEQQIIRDFQRRYDGPDRDLAVRDKLYCLALMQHHGAPTRLVDCTYSLFVATYFALESSTSSSVVWCINEKWCVEQGRNIVGVDIFEKRYKDEYRNDQTFLPLYMEKPLKKFVLLDNALPLNRRLIIQQGVFLCPGDVSKRFVTNLKAMPEWHEGGAIMKIRFKMSKREIQIVLGELHRMNVNRASMFPGLDGFAQSLKQGIMHYHDFDSRGVGG